MKKRKFNLFATSAILFGIAIALTMLIQGNPDFQAVRLDKNEEVITTDRSGSTAGFKMQALSDTELSNTLMSSVPLRDEEINLKLSATIKNPFTEEASLKKVKVEENGEEINTQSFKNIKIGPGQSYTYRTTKINLNPVVGENTIKLTFTFELSQEQRKTSYEYIYAYTKQCKGDDNCKNSQVCDRQNYAGFSSGGIYYCVDTCESTDDCQGHQKCFHKRCGYA